MHLRLSHHCTSSNTSRQFNNSDCPGGPGKETTQPSVKKYQHRRHRVCLDESESNIVNLSSFTLSSNHVSILNMGLSFIPSHLTSLPKLKRDFILFSDSLFSRFLPCCKDRSHPFYQKSNDPSALNTSQFPILHQYLHHTGKNSFFC